MSLTAHPFVVLAEQQWKQQNLGGASLAARGTPGQRGRRRRARVRTTLRLVAAGLHGRRHDEHRSSRHAARAV